MPVQCKHCGSIYHSTNKCKATPEKRLAFRVRNLALSWMNTNFHGKSDYLKGREAAINHCGSELYDLIKPYLKENDELYPQQDVV